MAAFSDLEEMDFVEEDMETSIKVLFLGAADSGKSTIISTMTRTSAPSRTLSVSYNEYSVRGGGERLMLYDTPSKYDLTGPAVMNCGSVILTVDMMNVDEYDDAVKGVSVELNKIKRKVTPLPPVIVCFTKWDDADRRGWSDRGSEFSAVYSEILRTCDAFIKGMYAVIRMDCREEKDVMKLVDKVVGNYTKWGKGTQDVLAHAEVVGGTGKKKKKKAPVSKKDDGGERDDGNTRGRGGGNGGDVVPVPKKLFGEEPAAAPSSVGGGKGTGKEVRKPRKRRTGGRKSLISKAADARKKVQEEGVGCKQS